MKHLILLALLIQSPSSESQTIPTELSARVEGYWNALVGFDKASAIQFVSPPSRNQFINRSHPRMRSWRLAAIEMISESKAKVSVEIERAAIPGGDTFLFSKATETWVLEDGLWHVTLTSLSQTEILQKYVLPSPRESSEPLSGEIKVLPDVLKVAFLSQRQHGQVRIRNERPRPLQIRSIEWDKTLFRMLESPGTLEPGDMAVLRIEYVGEEIKKNLESQLILHLLYDEKPEEFKLDVIYNYFSDGARGLFGLTEEEADELPRGVVPRPVIQMPKTGERPPIPPARPPR